MFAAGVYQLLTGRHSKIFTLKIVFYFSVFPNINLEALGGSDYETQAVWLMVVCAVALTPPHPHPPVGHIFFLFGA